MADRDPIDAPDALQTPVDDKTSASNGDSEPTPTELDPYPQPSYGIIDEGTIWPPISKQLEALRSRDSH